MAKYLKFTIIEFLGLPLPSSRDQKHHCNQVHGYIYYQLPSHGYKADPESSRKHKDAAMHANQNIIIAHYLSHVLLYRKGLGYDSSTSDEVESIFETRRKNTIFMVRN